MLFLHASFLGLLTCMHACTAYVPCLVCLLQPPFNLRNHRILGNILTNSKTTYSSCRPCILKYYCTVAATSAATKMPYTTVYLHIHAMCSRKLNTFNNQIIDLSTRHHLAIFTFLLHTHNLSSSSCANEYHMRHSAQCVFLVRCLLSI